MTCFSPLRFPYRPLVAGALTLLATAALAQSQPDGRWHGDASIGGSRASGNTTATTLSVRAEASKATVADKMTLRGVLNYGNSKVDGVETRSAELLRIGGRYDRNFGAKVFAFAGGDAEVNKPDGLKSRLAANFGAGYRVLRDAVTSWDVFGGVGYSDTSFTDGTSRAGAELLFGEESSHKLGPSTTVKQRLALYPGVQVVGQRATFDASLSTAIVGGWTFNSGLGIRYANRVAVGNKKSDTLLTFGFGYKY